MDLLASFSDPTELSLRLQNISVVPDLERREDWEVADALF
jgi:hypothetical protein